MNTSKIDGVIRHRVLTRVPFDFIYEHITEGDIYVAGNCLNQQPPHDIDLFPVDKLTTIDGSVECIHSTRNADSVKTDDGTIVQLCKYYHPSLDTLVDSFDFAHIQIGAKVHVASRSVSMIYYTDAWVEAHAVESTWFTGSQYPLSSLIRLNKYVKQGAFGGKAYIPSALNILMAIIERGVTSYDDYKDQLDAVDLGLVERDVAGVNFMRLFNLLVKDENLQREER